jgi:bile acid:Na+ symporter, BASS family
MSSLSALVPLVLEVSIVVLVFALGLRTTWADLTHLFRRPGLLARSLLSMIVAMPLVAVAMVLAFSLPVPVRIMLVALSLCPTPPLLPNKSTKSGGDASYAVSLLFVAALLSLVTVPVGIEVMQRIFGVELQVTAVAIAKVVLVIMIAPLVAGAFVGRLTGAFAETLSKWLSRFAAVALLGGLLVLYIANWRIVFGQFGGGTVIALALFTFAGLAIGHLLGGTDPADRTVLALATSSRHPGLAVTICLINFPDQRGVLPVMLIYLLVSGFCWTPYIAWRNSRGAVAVSV